MKRLILALALLAPAAGAADAKPVWSWISTSEYYFILPTGQDLQLGGGAGTERVKPWGFGVRGVGAETVGKTAALQLQSVKVDNPATGKNSFYLLELLLGLEYVTPRAEGRPLRFKGSALADLGLADNTLFAAPMLTAGLLYDTDPAAETPNGFTLDLFYRLTDVEIDNAGGGRGGTLKPALGVKVGYIFEGFWTVKDKSK